MNGEVDSDLLARLSRGEDVAFADLYDQYADVLFRTARGVSGSAAAAEDVVQDVFLNLFRRGEAIVRIRNMKAYLFTSLRNGLRRYRDAKIRRGIDAEEYVEQQQGVSVESVDANMSCQLETAMRELPIEQREVLLFKIDADLTFEELGGMLSISANTAASRYRYALAKLRERMKA